MTSNNPITKKILKNVIKLNARATTGYSNGTKVVEGLREFKYRIHRISITSTATAHTTKHISTSSVIATHTQKYISTTSTSATADPWALIFCTSTAVTAVRIHPILLPQPQQPYQSFCTDNKTTSLQSLPSCCLPIHTPLFCK